MSKEPDNYAQHRNAYIEALQEAEQKRQERRSQSKDSEPTNAAMAKVIRRRKIVIERPYLLEKVPTSQEQREDCAHTLAHGFDDDGERSGGTPLLTDFTQQKEQAPPDETFLRPQNESAEIVKLKEQARLASKELSGSWELSGEVRDMIRGGVAKLISTHK